MLLTALLRTPTLAIEAATPILSSNVMRFCSTLSDPPELIRPVWLIIMELVQVPPSMEDPATFVLSQAAEADFPTEYGLFRIYGFEGRTISPADPAGAR